MERSWSLLGRTWGPLGSIWGPLGHPRMPKREPKTTPKSIQKTSENHVAARWPPRSLQDGPGPPKGRPKTPQTPPRTPQMRPKRLQDRSKSAKFAPRASKSSRDVERKVDNKNLSRLKFAPRTSKSSRDDVERNLENKHFNLQSEAHAQNGQRGAARDERSEDLESEVRPIR